MQLVQREDWVFETKMYILETLNVPVFIHTSAQKAQVSAKTAIKSHKIWPSW